MWRSGSCSINGADERVNVIHVGIQFKGEACPVEGLESAKLLGEDSEAPLLQQIDLAVFDVAVIQAAHAAEQVTNFHQRDQSRVISRCSGCMVHRDYFAEVGREFPFVGQQTAAFAVSESHDRFLGFVEWKAFGACDLE